MMKNNIYGYIRVSSKEQNEDRQLLALRGMGVKFGRPSLPLPCNFYEIHKAWREKKFSLKQAAESCNMPVGIFYAKARALEEKKKSHTENL